MKNHILYLLFLTGGFFFFLHPLSAQQYKEMMQSGNYSLEEISEVAEKHFEKVGKGRGTGYKQFKRWEYNALRMQNDQGQLRSEADYLEDWQTYLQSQKIQLRDGQANDDWQEMGPTYWNATSSWNPGVGRITSVAVEKNNPDHIIVGAQTGGVWKTLDGGDQWTPLGDNFSNLEVYALCIHPNNPSVYYFGSSNGLIFKSENGGNTWSQTASLGGSQVRRLAMHPQHPDTLFASVQNAGLFRTLDGGENWQKTDAGSTGYDVKLNPLNPQTVIASGSEVYVSHNLGDTFLQMGEDQSVQHNFFVYSADTLLGNFRTVMNAFDTGQVEIPYFPRDIGGALALYQDADSSYRACSGPANNLDLSGKIALIRAGSCSFTEKVLAAQNSGAAAVLIINGFPGVAFPMGGGDPSINIPALMISKKDGDALFDLLMDENDLEGSLQNPVATNFENGPKMIGWSAADTNTLYVIEAQGSAFGRIYKSTDGGLNFREIYHGEKNYFGYSTQALDDRGQAPRDMAIAVNPYDADEVHIAGILSWVSFDGGHTFEISSDWIPGRARNQNLGYCHADIDDMMFVDSTLFLATDGGIYLCEETETISPDYYRDLSVGLGIRQFYKIGLSQTSPAIVTGGSQDNGTSVYSEEAGWIDWLGADGMETFVDKDDPDILYGTSQFGNMYVSYDRGNTYAGLPNPGSGSGRWVTPFEQDPVATNTIYVAYERVFRSSDGGWNWDPISQEFDEKLDHFKIAPTAPDIMYAAHGNSLFKTEEGGGEWTFVNRFGRRVNDIAIHPSDPQKVAIATGAGARVEVSRDGGETWETYKKNLPNFPALCLTWQAGTEDGLYLGMNYGIYYIDNSMNDWVLFDQHLPNVMVNELEINYAENLLYAATYGRGLWVSPLYGDFSSVESASTQSRLTIYPNPAKDQIRLSCDDFTGRQSTLLIFDRSGHLVRSKYNIRKSDQVIDIASLPPGTYYARWVGKETTAAGQFVVID